MKFNKEEVSNAPKDAILACIPGAEWGKVIHRQHDGGVIGDRSDLEGACLFPVFMLQVENLPDLPAGDWTVVPYVRDREGREIQTEAEYYSFEVNLVEEE